MRVITALAALTGSIAFAVAPRGEESSAGSSKPSSASTNPPGFEAVQEHHPDCGKSGWNSHAYGSDRAAFGLTAAEYISARRNSPFKRDSLVALGSDPTNGTPSGFEFTFGAGYAQSSRYFSSSGGGGSRSGMGGSGAGGSSTKGSAGQPAKTASVKGPGSNATTGSDGPGASEGIASSDGPDDDTEPDVFDTGDATLVAVPEPSTALFGLALTAAVGFARRRSSAASVT